MDALWPESLDPATALSVNLSRLRKLLGNKNSIYQLDGSTTLNSKTCWVDAWAFKRRAASASCLVDPQDLMKLYSGKFLPTDDDEPWAIRMREKLHRLFTLVVISQAHQLEQKQQWHDAARWYEYGLSIDDLYEPFYHGVMRCHVQTERPFEALDFYYRYELLLDAELSRKPSYAIQSLYKQIVKQTA